MYGKLALAREQSVSSTTPLPVESMRRMPSSEPQKSSRLYPTACFWDANVAHPVQAQEMCASGRRSAGRPFPVPARKANSAGLRRQTSFPAAVLPVSCLRCTLAAPRLPHKAPSCPRVLLVQIIHTWGLFVLVSWQCLCLCVSPAGSVLICDIPFFFLLLCRRVSTNDSCPTSGRSRAAKCPPSGYSVHCANEKQILAAARGTVNRSRGNMAMAVGVPQ